MSLWPQAAGAHEPITTKVRFNKEVVRIFQRDCLACHRPGGIAPFSLATYDEARPWAKAIKEEMLERRMPPWHAVKGYGEFRNAPRLTQREIDLIVNWVEGGAPKGEDKDLPAGPLFSDDWSLGKPDLILKPEAAYRVASDSDEYRTFSLATNLKEERWIRATDLRPGDGRVVHCATLHVERDKDELQKAILKSSATPTSSLHIPPSSFALATWVPGLPAVSLPEGAGQWLPAGSKINLKIHYLGAGEATKDRTAVGLYFTTRPARKHVSEVALKSLQDTIPAGARAHQVRADSTLAVDSEAVAIRPRAHPLVISLQATAYRPDGTEEVLIWTRGYRFDWQPTYYFKRPVSLPKGTRVEVVAYFDNSEENSANPNTPPKQVSWADLTTDPLCFLFIAYSRPGID